MTFAFDSPIITFAMRKCPACQQTVNPEAKFCNFCGHKLPVAVSVPQTNLLEKKFFSPRELDALDLAEKTAAELAELFRHSNKYLVRTALENFWQKAKKTEKTQILLEQSNNENFLACLLDYQPDAADLHAALWDKVSVNPWLARKYLLWTQQKNYALSPEAARYLKN